MKTIKLFSLIILCAFQAKATDILIIRGHLHTAAEKDYEDGLMVCRDGLISYVGIFNEDEIRNLDTSKPNIDFLDYRGQHIYPGLIALNSRLGITEIDLVRATRDFNEVGQNNADVRSLIAYNTDSKVVETVRSNGILLTEIAPSGGLISGQSSLVKTTAWNWEDAAIKTDKGLHLNWPSKINHRGWWAEPEAPEASKNAEKIETLKSMFNKAQLSYGTKAETDQKTKALWPLFSGRRTLMVHADAASDIVDAVLFFKSYGITPVIVGGAESWTITSFLKEHKVAVIIVRTHSLPTYNHTDVDMPYRLPAILSDSGVAFAITDQEHWQQRNLAFQAGTAIAYGLSHNEALRSITLYPAQIMGVADLYGSLEVGKTCTIIVSKGDLFDMRSSIIEKAYFNGFELDLNDKQKDLYRLYSERYFGED